MIESPNITATGDSAVEQMKSYLFRLAEQLNYSLQNVDKNIKEQETVIKQATAEPSAEKKAKTAVETFYTLKDLIIKSADIVQAYGDILEKEYNKKYVAQSAFGTYSEEAMRKVTETADLVSHEFVRKETTITPDEKASTLTANGRIKIGYLGTEYKETGNGDLQSVPVYGVEIGQTNTADGVETFNKFARFTADRLSFYGSGGEELAYFSGNEMHIATAVIDKRIKLGGYAIKTDGTGGEIAFKWVGVRNGN